MYRRKESNDWKETDHTSIHKSFQAVACVLSCNIYFQLRPERKSVRYLYERLQISFNVKDRRDAMMADVRGELTEAEKLLIFVRESREDAVMKEKGQW